MVVNVTEATGTSEAKVNKFAVEANEQNFDRLEEQLTKMERPTIPRENR